MVICGLVLGKIYYKYIPNICCHMMCVRSFLISHSLLKLSFGNYFSTMVSFNRMTANTKHLNLHLYLVTRSFILLSHSKLKLLFGNQTRPMAYLYIIKCRPNIKMPVSIQQFKLNENHNIFKDCGRGIYFLHQLVTK